MEENNRKGPGVFYAVVGVATLVVAIIGATFAFFSANATDDTVIIGTTASGNNIALAIEPIAVPIPEDAAGKTNNLVPMFQKDIALGLAGTNGRSCIDNNENVVCQVYKVTITNQGTAPLTIDATLNLSTAKGTGEGAGENMKWQLIKSATEVGDVGTMMSQGTAQLFADNKRLTEVALGDNVAEYYIMIWLLDTGTQQDDIDAGILYTGTVFVTAVGANGEQTSGLTASFVTQA